MAALLDELKDLNNRVDTLVSQNSAVAQKERMLQSLGHMLGLEKANSYSAITQEISKKLSSGSSIDEVITYLKSLYEAGKDIKLAQGSKFDEIKTATGEENFKKYME